MLGGARRVPALAPLACLLLLACTASGPSGPALPGEPAPPDARALEMLSRRALEDGRALRREGRHESAERVVRRALAWHPDDAKLQRELAHVLEALGRDAEADDARQRADALDPPPPPLPGEPLDVAAGRTLAIFVASHDGTQRGDPGRWPDEDEERTLARRLAVRLPGSEALRADPSSVGDAAAMLASHQAARVLTLRVDRADCRFSVKDGAIAVAELRVAAALRGGEASAPIRSKVVVEDPADEPCPAGALARALERALADPAVARVVSGAPAADAESFAASARALFPGIGRRVDGSLRRGESLLRTGQLGEAQAAFEAALATDPHDARALAYLDDTRRSLALAREIAAQRPSDAAPDSVDPRLSPEQRAAAEIALEREQRRRVDLLGALAVLDEDLRAPAPEALASLRASEIRRPDAFGPTLARRRAQTSVEARVAYAPDGGVLARYYFAPGTADPLLREEDTDGDGDPDRWIAYREGTRGEIFEDARGRGRPDRRLVFAEGGEPLTRIELDLHGDERPDRVFRYRDGALASEASDTDGDGRLDRFDRFGQDGHVDTREEDLDGDGDIDVKSVYRGGKLVRREIATPELAPES